jgi:hypothetical protein
MKARLLESLAILLAGLFAAESPRPWQLGDAVPRPKGAGSDDASPRSAAKRPEN